MILLPVPANRAALRSFWALLSLAIGSVAWTSLWLVGDVALVTGLGLGAGVAALAAAPGLLRPYWIWTPYRAWNWSVRRLSSYGARYVTAVSYWTVATALGWCATPGRFGESPGGSSMWAPRGTLSAEGYASQYGVPLQVTSSHWSAPLRAWMRSPGRGLTWTLLPFIALICWLDTGAQKNQSTAANIYTLY
jgi:hypothetical protein